MGRAATLDSVWPADGDPKTLLCVRVPCLAAELFKTLFVDPELQVQLHKQRNDSPLVETAWVASRDQLPPELYTWQAGGQRNEPGASLRFRKVRFESPPTALASKPFQNEETHVLTHWAPDQLYVLEAVSNTSAPYGDKFSVFFKYIIRPDASSPGTASCVLHLLFCVDFLPSMNRMMKPVIAKAIFRSVLGGLRPGTADVAEAELPPGGLLAGALASYSSSSGEESESEEDEAEGEGDEDKARKRHHHHHHHAFASAAPIPAPPTGPTPGAHPGMAAAPGLLSVFSQQLVYKDQVVLLADLVGAGLRSVTHSELGAQALAALLTVWLISLAVLTSLALVAAINWALIRGSEAAGKPGGTASMVWEQVVPQLPAGWRWVEDEWQIDLDGTEVEAVDGDGWSYALDFYLLKYPPPPQAGKCSLKHFVRRRRLFRTRVRLPDRSLLDSDGSDLLGLQLQPLSPDARTRRPVAGAPLPAGPERKAGGGATAPAVAVRTAVAGYAASPHAEHDSEPAARVSTEGYVLSPKTEVKAHDPLGALLQDEAAALAEPSSAAGGEGAALKGAAIVGQEERGPAVGAEGEAGGTPTRADTGASGAGKQQARAARRTAAAHGHGSGAGAEGSGSAGDQAEEDLGGGAVVAADLVD
eukprot:XP_001701512.1 predicted protein [Chlamydomonas reinhardtii]